MVYHLGMSRIRTNIEIEESDVRMIMERYSLRTMAGQPMTLEEALAMEGAHAIGEVPEDYGPHGIDDRPAAR